MPVVPAYESKEQLDTSLRSMPRPDFSTAQSQALSGLGKSIAGVGQQIGEVAQHWMKRQDERDTFRAGIEDDIRRQELAAEFRKAREAAPEDGAGFYESFLKKADEVAQSRFRNMPPAQAEKYAAKWQAERLAWGERAAAEEAGLSRGFARRKIDQTHAELLREIADNPMGADYFVGRGRERVLGSPLSSEEKAVRAQSWEATARATELRAKRVATGDVAGVARDLGMADPVGFSDVVDRIEGVESGGNPKAKNPNSSATGAGQFIEATWLAMIRKHRPDLATGSDAEILALRSNRELSREMIGAYARDNARFLAARGVATTPGNVYHAHFLGPEGAARVAGADAAAPVATLVDPAAVRANASILANKTAGDVVDWAARKMSGRKGDARYASLPVNEAQSILRETVQASRLEAANVRSLMNDDLASIMQTGAPVPDLTADRVARSLGLSAAAEFEATRTFARTYHSQTRDFETIPSAEILDRVDQLRPPPGSVGFVQQSRIADAAAARAKQIIEVRRSDPGGAVDNHPSVKAAMDAVGANRNDPAAWREAVRARMAAQEAIGVPEADRAPLSNAMAQRFFSPVLNAPEGQQAAELRKVAQQFDAVFGELAPKVFASAIASAGLDKETRTLAGGILRKLGLGQKPSREEMTDFEETRANGVAQRAAQNVAPSTWDYIGLGEDPAPMPGPVPSGKAIPRGAIDHLQANPAALPDFMAKYGAPEYGPGVAARVAERLGLTTQKAPR